MSESNALQALQKLGGVPTVPVGGEVVVNPLAAITAGNQAAQQEFETRAWQAKQAAGNAFLRSIDPNTGQPNQAQLLRNLASDPTSALAAQNSAQAGQTLDTGTYDLHNKRLTSMMSGMGQLIADNPNGVPAEAAAAVVDHRLSLGLITPEQARAMKGRLTDDPVKNSQLILQGMTGNLSAQSALEAAKPRIGTQDLGGRVIGTQTAPLASGTAQPGAINTVGSGIDYGLTPGQRGVKVEWENPQTGAKEHGTLEEMHKALGIPTPSGPAVGGADGAPSVKPPPPPAGSKARTSTNTTLPPPPPDILKGPITPDAAGDAAPPKKGGASITGAAPGVTEAAKLSAEDSAKAGAALVARGDQAPSAKANYANMMSDLDRLGSMPASPAKQIAIETFLRKATGYGVTMTADQVAAANSFSKLANIAVGQQLAAIGGTDARQNLFMGSSPNLDLSKLGNQQIIHMLQGNEDAIQAKSRAWNDWANEHGTHTYRQFQNDWNHHFDPRVFQQQYYQPDEVEALKKSLAREGKGATAKFWEDVDYAKANKMIP